MTTTFDATYTLEDRYARDQGRVFLNGHQAMVRVLLMQHERDQAAGLHTAGFVSGYRGSPLGVLDLALWDAGDRLREHEITFQPGVNEELAATAVWGTQQLEMIGESRYDGVFGMWYGKGPGVDRASDALKTANYAGTANHGGVLALCGDDHAAALVVTRPPERVRPASPSGCRSSTRLRCRTTSTSVSTATPCPGSPAAGSVSSASPRRSRRPPRWPSTTTGSRLSCPMARHGGPTARPPTAH